MEIKTTEEILIADMYEDVFNKDNWLNKKWIAVDDMVKELKNLEPIGQDVDWVFIEELIKKLK